MQYVEQLKGLYMQWNWQEIIAYRLERSCFACQAQRGVTVLRAHAPERVGMSPCLLITVARTGRLHATSRPSVLQREKPAYIQSWNWSLSVMILAFYIQYHLVCSDSDESLKCVVLRGHCDKVRGWFVCSQFQFALSRSLSCRLTCKYWTALSFIENIQLDQNWIVFMHFDRKCDFLN